MKIVHICIIENVKKKWWNCETTSNKLCKHSIIETLKNDGLEKLHHDIKRI